MSVLEVIGVYVVIPGAIVAVIGLMTVGAGRHRATVHYEPGRPWEHPDHLWSGDTPVISAPVADRVGSTVGGARGSW